MTDPRGETVPVSPASPERRGWRRPLAQLRPGARAFEVARRVVLGVYADGFIHAGNIAYLSLISLFPFFIVTAALAHALGQGPETIHAIDGYLQTLPKAVRELVRPPITDVLKQRTGALLWFGGLIGLWTTGSFIETIRDILRRAYGTPYSAPFWHYRLGSAALIVASVIATFASFSLQLLVTAIEQAVLRLFPFAQGALGWIGWSRLAPLAFLVGTLYLLFYSLTPTRYRYSRCPKWPGALFTAVWWVLVTMGLPWVLAQLGGYGRTYGSLAGVVVALLFFWFVGLGVVIGAQLNAALAEPPAKGVRSAHETAEERCQG